MRNLALEFDVPNLRAAGRPAEYARTADRSEEAAKGVRKRHLVFIRKQVE
jgi:hypothetical protein